VTDEGDGGEDAVAADPPAAAPAKMKSAATAVKAVAAAAGPTGWKIQIAAAPTDASAKEQLDKVRAKAGKLLASASPYTEAVAKGDATFYRARFSGFANEAKAVAACAALKREKISCLALE
jgi:hypothetical protein